MMPSCVVGARNDLQSQMDHAVAAHRDQDVAPVGHGRAGQVGRVRRIDALQHRDVVPTRHQPARDLGRVQRELALARGRVHQQAPAAESRSATLPLATRADRSQRQRHGEAGERRRRPPWRPAASPRRRGWRRSRRAGTAAADPPVDLEQDDLAELPRLVGIVSLVVAAHDRRVRNVDREQVERLDRADSARAARPATWWPLVERLSASATSPARCRPSQAGRTRRTV